jgi:plastocyanin
VHMNRLLGTATLTLALLANAACDQPAAPVQPDRLAAVGASGELERRIAILDACDPATFNAVLGPGTCIRSGGVTFQRFLALLEQNGEVGSWRFSPPNLNAQVGQTLLAVNHGGEVHTFTEVEEFGGGIVASLNALSGNTEVASECQALDADDFVPPGGTYEEEIEEEGSEHYQCCIHPWMRTTVNAREP